MTKNDNTVRVLGGLVCAGGCNDFLMQLYCVFHLPVFSCYERLQSQSKKQALQLPL